MTWATYAPVGTHDPANYDDPHWNEEEDAEAIIAEREARDAWLEDADDDWEGTK